MMVFFYEQIRRFNANDLVILYCIYSISINNKTVCERTCILHDFYLLNLICIQNGALSWRKFSEYIFEQNVNMEGL